MADVSNAEAIRFVNEQIRPLAESVRALKARIDAATVKWFGGINTTIGTSADDAIADGREAEGVSRLTAADVTGLMTQLLAIQATLDGAGVAGVVEKPCVRTLEVSL
jgi:hypothetical protein